MFNWTLERCPNSCVVKKSSLDEIAPAPLHTKKPSFMPHPPAPVMVGAGFLEREGVKGGAFMLLLPFGRSYFWPIAHLLMRWYALSIQSPIGSTICHAILTDDVIKHPGF